MPPPKTKSKNTYLITGGSSGIGLALSLHLLRQSPAHRVIATTRSIRRAPPSVTQNGGKYLEVDITSPSAPAIIAHECEREDVDVLVNSAGIAVLGAVEDVDEEGWRRVMDVNFFGVVGVVRGVLGYFRHRHRQRQVKAPGGEEVKWRGTIVNVSSGAALIGRPLRGPYAASKAALESASESLAAEVAPLGIRVLVVDLGAFKTGFGAAAEMTPLSDAYTDGPAAKVAGAAGTTRWQDPGKVAVKIWEVVEGVRGEGVVLAEGEEGEEGGEGEVVSGMATGGLGQGGGEVFRIVLGRDCEAVLREKVRWLERDRVWAAKEGWVDCYFDDEDGRRAE